MPLGTWYRDRPWPRPHCVRWEPSSPTKNGAEPPQVSAHVFCGQTAGWIQIALDMEVGLGQGHIVQDGDPAPSHKKVAEPTILGPCLVAKRLNGSRRHLIGTEVGLGPGDSYVMRYPPAKGHSSPHPLFGPCLCGHGRPSQLLLSCCNDFPENQLKKFRAV